MSVGSSAFSVQRRRLNEAWFAAHGLNPEDLERAVSSLLEERPTISTTKPVGGIPLFIKVYSFPCGRDRLRRCFGLSAGARAYDNALRLQAVGVDCPAPLVVLRHAGAETLVTEALCEGETLGEWLRAALGNVRAKRAAGKVDCAHLLQQLARFLSHLHERGVYHSDLHDRNLWARAAESDLRFYLLDVEAVKFGRHISASRRRNNLLRLARNIGAAAAGGQVEAEALAVEFADEYFRAGGFPPSPQLREGLKTAVRRGTERWREISGAPSS